MKQVRGRFATLSCHDRCSLIEAIELPCLRSRGDLGKLGDDLEIGDWRLEFGDWRLLEG